METVLLILIIFYILYIYINFGSSGFFCFNHDWKNYGKREREGLSIDIKTGDLYAHRREFMVCSKCGKKKYGEYAE